MKKLAFVFGYAGSILALIFALLMIYTVPMSILSDTLDEARDDLDNVHVAALNETVLQAIESEADMISEADMKDVARDAAAQNDFIEERTYLKAVTFAFDCGRAAALSVLLVGVTLVFALIAFIGSLLCKKHPQLGGVFVVISALALLLTSIATGTLVPMIFAVVLLFVSGTVAFVHPRTPAVGYASAPAVPFAPAGTAQPMPSLQAVQTEMPMPVADPDDVLFAESETPADAQDDEAQTDNSNDTMPQDVHEDTDAEEADEQVQAAAAEPAVSNQEDEPLR